MTTETQRTDGMTTGPQGDDSLVAAFAAGTAGPATSMLLAAQASLNPVARERLAFFEGVGGSLFDTLEPEVVSEDLLDRVMAALDGPDDDGAVAASAPSDTVASRASQPQPGGPFLPTAVMEAV